MKKTLAILMILLWMIPLTACGSSSAGVSSDSTASSGMRAAGDTGTGAAVSKGEAARATGAPSAAETAQDTAASGERKIVRNAAVSMETLEFQKTIDAVSAKVKAVGGYIESSNVSGFGINADRTQQRSAYFSVRIPQAQFDAFLSAVGSMGNVTEKQIGGSDITEQYSETESHLKALRVQEERMLALVAKADKLEDILQIEKELTNCRAEIENLTNTIKRYDSLIQYNQVSLSIIEVSQISPVSPMPKTLGERIANTFRESLQALRSTTEALLLVAVAVFPFLWIVLLVGGVVWLIRRKRARKAAPKAETPKDEKPEDEETK